MPDGVWAGSAWGRAGDSRPGHASLVWGQQGRDPTPLQALEGGKTCGQSCLGHRLCAGQLTSCGKSGQCSPAFGVGGKWGAGYCKEGELLALSEQVLEAEVLWTPTDFSGSVIQPQ